jgi:hypothetical protein
MLKVQPGKFYRIKNSDKKSSANDHYNMIIVENNDGEIQELLFTDSDLIRATVRSKKNSEDIPRYSLVLPEGGFVYAIALTSVGIVCSLVGYFLKDLGIF